MTHATRTSGFTLIEVMLFLAVSAFLTIALIVGSSTAIQQQRYRDSVNTAVLELQTQFTKASQVSNYRDSGWLCSPGSISQRAIGTKSRGASNCTMVGRYVTISPNGERIIGYPVIATQAIPSGAASDSAALSAMSLVIHRPSTAGKTVDESSHTLEWNSRIIEAGGGAQAMPMSLLIYRSPITGSVGSFAFAKSNASIGELLGAGAARSAMQFCVAGDALGAPVTGIEIAHNASTSTAVRIVGENICR